MKKTYNTPEMVVVKMVISTHLLEVSGNGIKGNAPDNAVGLSRETDFWGDEDY